MGVELANERAQFLEMEEVNFTDNELVYHVRTALKSASSGDSESYDELIGVMHHRERLSPDEVAMLVTCLKALSGTVSCIDVVHHESLLSSIFGMSMWNYGPEVMDALVDLIISLAASSGKFVDSCLDMLIRNFVPPYSYLALLKQPRGLSRKDQVLSRVHSALESISHLVPLAPMRLLSLVIQRMPRQNDNETVMMTYVENMFKLESGSMGQLVGSTMLIAVVDRLLDLDLEIGWEDIVQDDSSKGIFEMELEDLEEDEEDLNDEGDELPGKHLSRNSLRGNVIAEKLDSLLVLTFEYLESCQGHGRLLEVFETLLHSFRITVLNAYKSKFAQFVMFYACALDPENCGVRFARMLVDIFVCHDHPPMTRMSAVAYLASYLSRGKFLSANYITTMLKRLVDWCLDYCNVQDGDVNPFAHRVFYAGCQAIMYVLCFRMTSIMSIPRLKSQLFLMPIETILKHKSDPLKVCLPSVVGEFLKQARAARLFTVTKTFIFDDILESELSRAFGGLERLDSFFPFDPCLLKKSDSFIRPNFIFWSMVKTTYDDDEDRDEDEEGSGDEDGEESVDGVGEDRRDRMATSFNEQDIDIEEFDYALNKMSITPKQSLMYKFGGGLEELVRMPSRIRPSTSPESL
ncbi:RNA polymerase I-specific transcription initiation factor rrn3 isoform X2 [Rhodamnia argentea]|nr:RNA polymerase I-specific transcription initiation factor rrn3 isoform X2 [Rhodamnia argentea]XP_030535856.1 RNA polymerase I-specific transcription initiation factor rrn3 isoform X2 [Rhodamnia argentea]